jgi:serine/threonine-protein kinase
MGAGATLRDPSFDDSCPTGTLVLRADERDAQIRNLVDLHDDPTTLMVVPDGVMAVAGHTEWIIGEYQVGELLGQGGMGVVHRAQHRRSGTAVAMKLLRPDVSARPLVVRRFVREGRVLARLRDPGIVHCHEVGVARVGTPYIVMEYLEGATLGALLVQQPRLERGLALVIARQVARALGAAHRSGVVHRDVKPSNVFLVAEPGAPGGVRAKVMDFGLAKLLEPDEGDPHPSTATGSLIGTPAYMSPEQCRGAGEIDARSDIYSLGCVLYAMLCGRPPFQGQGMGDYVTAHLLESPAPPSVWQPSIPPRLDQIIMTALAKHPGHRQQTMDELAIALEGDLSCMSLSLSELSQVSQASLAPRWRRPRVRALAAAALALMSVLVIAGVSGGDESRAAAPAAVPAPAPIAPSAALVAPAAAPAPVPAPVETREVAHPPLAPRPRKRTTPAAPPTRARGDVMEPSF